MNKWASGCLQNGPCKDVCVGGIQGGQQCWSQSGSSEPCTSFSFTHITMSSPAKALLAPQIPHLGKHSTKHLNLNSYPISHEDAECLRQPRLEMALDWLRASFAGCVRVGPLGKPGLMAPPGELGCCCHQITTHTSNGGQHHSWDA